MILFIFVLFVFGFQSAILVNGQWVKLGLRIGLNEVYHIYYC